MIDLSCKEQKNFEKFCSAYLGIKPKDWSTNEKEKLAEILDIIKQLEPSDIEMAVGNEVLTESDLGYMFNLCADTKNKTAYDHLTSVCAEAGIEFSDEEEEDTEDEDTEDEEMEEEDIVEEEEVEEEDTEEEELEEEEEESPKPKKKDKFPPKKSSTKKETPAEEPKKRGRKPKQEPVEETKPEPKKRGRKPKIETPVEEPKRKVLQPKKAKEFPAEEPKKRGRKPKEEKIDTPKKAKPETKGKEIPKTKKERVELLASGTRTWVGPKHDGRPPVYGFTKFVKEALKKYMSFSEVLEACVKEFPQKEELTLRRSLKYFVYNQNLKDGLETNNKGQMRLKK